MLTIYRHTASSYGRTIYTADENPIGVIVITTEHEALFRTFQELVRDGARVYHP